MGHLRVLITFGTMLAALLLYGCDLPVGGGGAIAPRAWTPTPALVATVTIQITNASFQGDFMADNRPSDIDFLSLTHSGYQISGLLVVVVPYHLAALSAEEFKLQGTGDDTASTVTLYSAIENDDYLVSKSGPQLTLSFPRNSLEKGSRNMTSTTKDKFNQLYTTWQDDLSRQYPQTPTPLPSSLPFLGITYDALSPNNATQYDVRDENGELLTTGLLLIKVESGSPAEQAGLKVGDVILTINSIVVDSDNALPTISFLDNLQPGDTIPLTVLHNSKRIHLQVTLRATP